MIISTKHRDFLFLLLLWAVRIGGEEENNIYIIVMKFGVASLFQKLDPNYFMLTGVFKCMLSLGTFAIRKLVRKGHTYSNYLASVSPANYNNLPATCIALN